MRIRFSIRDLLWLTVVVAIFVAIWVNCAGRFRITDSKVIWVNERDRAVFVNLGSADGLKKRATFSVFDPSTTDARKKGAIEVINVTQPHMAECRILSDSTTSPLLPGDLVFPDPNSSIESKNGS
jgi:hypothetical protein